jgi:hypothetical protein
MLGVSNYDQDYIDKCRDKVAAQISGYQGLATAARNGAKLDSEIDALAASKTIKLKPELSMLHLEVGDEIALGASDFQRLAEAFFAEIEAKYR